MKKLTLISLILFILSLNAAKLEFIGNPLGKYSPEAARINTLKSFNNRLYLGFGDAGYNTGETDIIYYDPQSNKFVIEGRIQDEAIIQYCIIDSFLIIPGVDATESWDYGNIYYTSKKQEWTKQRTIPNGIHVFDAIKHDDQWLVGTGCFFNLQKNNDKAINTFGGIFATDDKGKSWNLSYATPSDNRTTFRIKQLFKVGNEVYATFYGYYAVNLSDLTPGLQEKYKDVPLYEGYLLMTRDDIFGDSDILHFEDGFWKMENRFEIKNLAYHNFIPLGDKAIATTFTGSDLPYQMLGKFAKREIFLFDNDSTTVANLPFDYIISHKAESNNITCLVTKDEQYYIATTSDLISWKLESLNTDLKLTSIEILDDMIFLGENNGNIYRFNPKSKNDRFVFQAQKFNQGAKYNVKISEWIDWTKKCNVDFARQKNKYNIQTENVKSFFVDLDDKSKLSKKLRFRINNRTYTVKDLSNTKSLEFELTNEKWLVIKHENVISELDIIEPILAVVDLPNDNIRGWQSDLKCKAIAYDTAFDLTICGTGFRDVLRSDTLRVSDIFRINYDNEIYEVKLTGKVIKKILADNPNLLFFSKSELEPIGLDDNSTYKIATTNYLYDTKIKSVTENFTVLETSVVKSMINYLTNIKH
jgi:hypothetical protein